MRRPHWRAMSWVVLIFNLLMLVWLIVGVGAATSNSCAGKVGEALKACQAGTAVGAGIGAVLIVVLWVFGDIILGTIWLVTGRGGEKKQRIAPTPS